MAEALDMQSRLRKPAIAGRPVTDPADWRSTDLDEHSGWRFHIDAEDLAEMRAMARSIRAVIGNDPNGLLSLPTSAFDFGGFRKKIDAIRHELKDGCGAALIRALPIEDMDRVEAATIYWGIGRHLGAPCSNNPQGDMLGHVTDLGKTQKDVNSRGYQTREELTFHCDQCSIVGLLCARTAKAGGISKISSSIAVYNELLKRSPQSVAALCEPLCWSKHGEVDKDQLGYYESPVFNFQEGLLSTSFGPTHITKGHQLPGAPAMTDAQREAIAQVKRIAEELHYAMELQPGDIQLLNNSVAFHSRTEYEDWPDPAKKRLLYRLWLVAPDIRPPTPYISHWKAGVKLSTTKERIVL